MPRESARLKPAFRLCASAALPPGHIFVPARKMPAGTPALANLLIAYDEEMAVVLGVELAVGTDR